MKRKQRGLSLVGFLLVLGANYVVGKVDQENTLF